MFEVGVFTPEAIVNVLDCCDIARLQVLIVVYVLSCCGVAALHMNGRL